MLTNCYKHKVGVLCKKTYKFGNLNIIIAMYEKNKNYKTLLILYIKKHY